jgi:hypothetical protein
MASKLRVKSRYHPGSMLEANEGRSDLFCDRFVANLRPTHTYV